ncbi:MAG: hypothetical protein UX31_C0004G0026 [Candidatus Nomurabacteria bacterium GW2011_GWA1_46_11]|uniref:Uncharacterized protein n=1 Tax=Candidatus Nomurabacteria bacterium GW2011_GWA1_46_11 TaxID=1618732 RepID=A0A0G1NPP8_9BACT|nr:MAG: hypothetical protein UX31_C0004G0026 [Candidatus Nomurabacteria bacterium GW2011_GWA1_46_11]
MVRSDVVLGVDEGNENAHDDLGDVLGVDDLQHDALLWACEWEKSPVRLNGMYTILYEISQ